MLNLGALVVYLAFGSSHRESALAVVVLTMLINTVCLLWLYSALRTDAHHETDALAPPSKRLPGLEDWPLKPRGARKRRWLFWRPR